MTNKEKQIFDLEELKKEIEARQDTERYSDDAADIEFENGWNGGLHQSVILIDALIGRIETGLTHEKILEKINK